MKYWGIALLGGALIGCGGGGDGDDEGPAADAAPVDGDMGPQPDAAPATLSDQLQDFCDRAARARCEWAFDCVGAGPQLYSGLGLQGPTIDDCAADWSASCFADADARAERGTLDFSPDAVEACVAGLGDAPCVGADNVSEWVGDWHKFVDRRCGSVIRGAVGSGDACQTRNDCQVSTEICDGTCRAPMNADVGGPCAATGAGLGALNADADCPGEVCVQVGANAQDVAGLCTADCQRGSGCPGGAFCLQLAVNDEPPSFFCTLPCTQDRDCAHDLVCVPVDPNGDPDTKHCFVSDE